MQSSNHTQMTVYTFIYGNVYTHCSKERKLLYIFCHFSAFCMYVCMHA